MPGTPSAQANDLNAAREWLALSQGDSSEQLDEVGQRILDAALACFKSVGLRRSSMEDIARRAKVGRVTIYRRYASKEGLVETVLLREVRRELQALRELIAAQSTIEARIELAFLSVMRRSQEHSLIARLLEVEPEEILRFLSLEAGPILTIGSRFIEERIRESQGAGLIPNYPPQPVAEFLARFAHSTLLCPRGGLDVSDEAKLRAFARTTVVPLLIQGLPKDDSC